MYTIGKLAKEFDLSRSTLLYYDRIGILKPSGRSKSNYRIYSQDDREILKLITQYREAGIPLDDIARLINAKENSITRILTDRLDVIRYDIQNLKKQEKMILAVLIERVSTESDDTFNKKSWTELLTNLGFSQEDQILWHGDFERESAQDHATFLVALGMNETEIKNLRDKIKHHIR